MILETLHEWMMGLSADYSVNPYIFAAIYVGAIPFFMGSVAWIIRNLKRSKPIALPVISTGFCLSSAYLYLLTAGENIPSWVYAVVILLLVYGLYSTYQRIKDKRKDSTI
ncbi:hypothetical protein [Aliifodinibius salipaludis]|nr:hypothetical protein [Aliifodinibius salipaludis]